MELKPHHLTYFQVEWRRRKRWKGCLSLIPISPTKACPPDSLLESWFLVNFPPSYIQVKPWTQISIYFTSPRSSLPACKGRARPPLKTHLLPNVTLLPFLKFPLGPGTAINRESGFEPISIIYYLYDIGGLTTKLLMQTLMFFFNC